MGRQKVLGLIIADILILVAVIGLIVEIFSFRRFTFYAEFFLLLGIISISFVGLIAAMNSIRWGSAILSASFLLILADLLFLFFINREFSPVFVIASISAVLGFLTSIMAVEKKSGDNSAGNVIEEIEPPQKRRKK